MVDDKLDEVRPNGDDAPTDTESNTEEPVFDRTPQPEEHPSDAVESMIAEEHGAPDGAAGSEGSPLVEPGAALAGTEPSTPRWKSWSHRAAGAPAVPPAAADSSGSSQAETQLPAAGPEPITEEPITDERPLIECVETRAPAAAPEPDSGPGSEEIPETPAAPEPEPTRAGWKFWARNKPQAVPVAQSAPEASTTELPAAGGPEAAPQPTEPAAPAATVESATIQEVTPAEAAAARPVVPAAVLGQAPSPLVGAEQVTAPGSPATEQPPTPSPVLGEAIPSRPKWKFWAKKTAEPIPQLPTAGGTVLPVPSAATSGTAGEAQGMPGAEGADQPPIIAPVAPEAPQDAWATRSAAPVPTDQFGWPVTGAPGDQPSAEQAGAEPTAILPPVEAPYSAEPAAQTAVLPLPADILAPVPDANAVGSVSGAAATAALAPPVAIDMGPERRSNYWIWIGVAVGVILTAAIIAYGWWYTTSRAIAVPNVVGKLSAQAAQTLNDADLRLGKVSEVPTDTAPPGTVINQTPSAYSSLKPGETVAIVVAGPPEMTKVPEVSGRSVDEAIATLASARLAARVVETYNTTVAAGFVISQLPSATTELEPGSLVVLPVSRGPAPATQRVPQVTGLNQSDAAALLSPLGFRFVAVRSFNTSVPVGVVMSQTPMPESQNPPDTVVLYSVSAGPGLTTASVPNVANQIRAEAERRVTQAGLRSQVIEVAHATVAKGSVISQMPPASAAIENGGTVALLVSKGAATASPVPDLTAKRSEEASSAATTAGYLPVLIEVATGDYPVGSVFGQWPPPGTPAPAQTPLIALVAKTPVQ